MKRIIKLCSSFFCLREFNISSFFTKSCTLAAFFFLSFFVNSTNVYNFDYQNENDLGVQNTLELDPPSISNIRVDTQNLVLNLLPNTQNDSIILICQTKGDIVVPSGILHIGDTLDNRAQVVYMGMAKDNISIANLRASTAYIFTAWSLSEGLYSPDTVSIGVHTWIQLPYLWNFDKEKVGYEQKQIPVLPIGWSRSIDNLWQNNFRVGSNMSETDIFMQGFAHYDNDEGRSEMDTIDLITPTVYLEAGPHRIFFDYNFVNNGWIEEFEAYPLKDSDSLCLQISDNGIDFKTLYVLNKSNTEAMNIFTKTSCTFDIAKAQSAKFRFAWHSQSLSTARIDNIKIEGVSPCDYPVDIVVIDSTISTSTAKLQWEDVNDDTPLSWRASFRAQGSDTWSEAQELKENPGVINNLPSQTFFEVRLQAVCSEKSISPWSEASPLFMTKYVIPFTCDFNDWLDSWKFEYLTKPHWGRATGKLPLEEDYVVVNDITWKSGGWSQAIWRNQLNSVNKSYYCDFAANTQSWFLSPSFDLGEDQAHSRLSFDFSLNAQYKPDASVDSVNSEARFVVLISTNGGKSYNAANILDSWGKGSDKALKNLDSVHVDLNLADYKGKVQIGFYIENPLKSSANRIFVDNLKVDYTCYAPHDLMAINIGEDTAQVAWESSTSAAQWIVRYRPSTASTYQYVSTDTKTMVFRNLEAATVYEWGIVGICEIGDTSAWANQTFTTQAPYVCDTVTKLKMASVNRFDVTLKWNATAAKYTVAYKEADKETWNFAQTENTQITISSLLPETRYAYRVQAQCSDDASDTSVWTCSHFFTTLINSCIPPQDITIKDIQPTRASISYTSESSNFEIWLATGNGIGESIFIPKTDVPYTLLDLTAVTKYNLKMRSVCGINDTSVWSQELSFTTTKVPDTISIENGEAFENFTVYSSVGKIYIANPSQRIISKVEVQTILGQTLGSYIVNSSDLICLPFDFKQGIYLVKLYSEKQQFIYKIFVK